MNSVSSYLQVPFVSVKPSSTDYRPLASFIRTTGCKTTNAFEDCALTTTDDGAIITLTKYTENNIFVVKGTGEYTVYEKIFNEASKPELVAYLISTSGPSAESILKNFNW